MSPRVAKKDKGVLPKTEVTAGVLSFYGVNDYTLSQLAQGRCDSVIGIKDARISETLRNKPTISTDKGPIDLTDKVYNGLSDSFYRGTFPHVLVVSCGLVELDAFMDDVLDHIEKMVSVGFFFQFPNPAETLLPNIVIACNGIYFHALQKKLSLMMDGLKTLDTETKNAVFSKFMRGIFSDYSVLKPYGDGDKISSLKPVGFKIAGGSRTNRFTVATTLENKQLPSIEAPQMNQVIDAIELENGLRRLTQVILPSLAKHKVLNKKESEKLTKDLQNAILDIGQHRNSFHDDYGFDFLQDDHIEADPPVDFGDLSTLRALAHYAKDAELLEASTQFEALGKQLQDVLQG